MPPGIPRHELDLLQITLDEAVEYAGDGNVADGYESLQGALYRAETIEVEAEWGSALVRRYREALETYTRLYGAPRKE
jgi:hypothetical protein